MDKKDSGSGSGSGPPRQPPNPALPYREDCWSEGATSTLIDAWGDRYLELNRGNIRQKQWQEVADAVNSRQTAVKRPSRTDVQCKNRIDTLKKKYKLEKAKIVESNGVLSSHWPFYNRLDVLIGPVNTPAAKKPSPSPPPPMALPLPYRKNRPLPPAAAVAARPKRPLPEDSVLRKGSYTAAAAAAAAAKLEEDDEVDSESSRSSTERSERGGWREMNGSGSGLGGKVEEGTDGVKELARAIGRFGEIYERVESAKQKQMVELEKQRMEFTKGLEFQRMQIFVDLQVQLRKIKRKKGASAGPSSGGIWESKLLMTVQSMCSLIGALDGLQSSRQLSIVDCGRTVELGTNFLFRKTSLQGIDD